WTARRCCTSWIATASRYRPARHAALPRPAPRTFSPRWACDRKMPTPACGSRWGKATTKRSSTASSVRFPRRWSACARSPAGKDRRGGSRPRRPEAHGRDGIAARGRDPAGARERRQRVNQQEQFRLKVGLAEMLKGGVIMDVQTADQARIAEQAGASAVMALERIPARIRREGGVARMSDPRLIKEIE